MPTDVAQSQDVSVRVKLSSSLIDKYSAEATARGLDLETVLSERLSAVSDQNPATGIMLKITPDERRRIEAALSRSFPTGADLTQYLESAFSVVIEGVQIQLAPNVLQRFQTRSGRIPFKQYIHDTVLRQVEHIAGVR